MFFWGGGGGGEEESSGQVLLSRFRRTTRVFKQPHFLCYIIALFKFRQPVDLFHTLKTVKGLMHLVPPRTPPISGYGVLCTCGLCCHML